MNLRPARALELIQAGKISPGYALLGQELYWRDRIWAALRKVLRLDGDPSGISDLDLRQCPISEVLESARERSLWASRQLLLVRNAQLLTPTKGLAEVGKYFGDPSPHSTLILEMVDVSLDEEDWREKEKLKSRQEVWDGICDVVFLASPSQAEAMELIRKEAAARGRKISPDAAETLVTLLGANMGRIISEVEKLCLYEPDGAEITVEQVHAVAAGSTASLALPLLDAIASGDSRIALEAIAQVHQQETYLPLVLAEITRYLRQLLLLKQNNVRDGGQASRILWSARMPAPQPSLAGMVRQARAVTIEHLTACLRAALRADVALRSSPADERLILERFVLEIVQPVSGVAASRI